MTRDEPSRPKQGDVRLLEDPVAQELLNAPSSAHLAYTWRDGSPRVVPIGVFWNGQELVIGAATDSPRRRC